VRTAVSADPSKLAQSQDGYRLIVQSYARSSLGQGELPEARVRPLASAQRAITPEELARGVTVDVLGVDGERDASMVVAWVERGRADLDFDALEARPGAGAFYGVARTSEAPEARTAVVLRQHVAS
jgi:hypothetical protein